MNIKPGIKRLSIATITLIILCTGVHTPTVYAAPSQGKVTTACKNKIHQVLGKDVRTKIHRYRRAAVTFKIKTSDSTRTIKCVFKDNRAELYENDSVVEG